MQYTIRELYSTERKNTRRSVRIKRTEHGFNGSLQCRCIGHECKDCVPPLSRTIRSVVPRFSPPFPPSLVDLVSIGLVSISTDLVSVMVPGGWLPLAELPWMPVCPAQGLWLKARCSPWNPCPLWQAPSPSSSIGDEFKGAIMVFKTSIMAMLVPS